MTENSAGDGEQSLLITGQGTSWSDMGTKFEGSKGSG